jgi:hypothetical protein
MAGGLVVGGSPGGSRGFKAALYRTDLRECEKYFGVFDTQEQAAQAIAAGIGYAAGGGLHLRRPPDEDSGVHGVTMRRNAVDGQMWRSNIHVNGGKFALGSFDTKEEAAAAFDRAARLHFKEEAKFNFDRKMEADEARREAIQTRVLIQDGRIELIRLRAIDFRIRHGDSKAEAQVYGEAKEREACEYILTQLPIWREAFDKERSYA